MNRTLSIAFLLFLIVACGGKNDKASLENAWTKQWGSESYDYGASVAIDSSGNVYVTGKTEKNIDENIYYGGEDVFLTKFNKEGTKVWTKQWGTKEDDYGISIAIDSYDNIYVTGETYGGLDENASAGGIDVFLTKWDKYGAKVWTKQIGDDQNNFILSVTVDYLNDIYLTGHGFANCIDIFLAKFNSDGSEIWRHNWGTPEHEYGYSVKTDLNNNLYVTGFTSGNLDGNTNAGNTDVFLTKWNIDGTLNWTTMFGSKDYEEGYSLAIDSVGNIYVTGFTSGSVDGHKNAGFNDVILIKWNQDGTKAWTKQWGTEWFDTGYSVTVDTLDNVYVAGDTSGSLDGNLHSGGFCNGYPCKDVFLTKWTADGTKIWTKQWGTEEIEKGGSVAADLYDNIYVTGWTAGNLYGTLDGRTDIFLAKWYSEELSSD